MRKLIVALHGAGLRARLVAPSFRQALAATGATAVQVNLDDDDVAPALRFGPGTPITALVSVWTTGDPAVAVAAVGAGASDGGGAGEGHGGGAEPHAYLVTEKVRLDPAPVPDGHRADVLAQVALLRRPASMSRQEYLDYWLGQHTAIAVRTQGTVCYVQNVVEDVLTPSSPPVAAIVEEHFPMAALTDPHAFYGSRGDDAELRRRSAELMSSVARFGADQGLDLVPTSRYCWAALSPLEDRRDGTLHGVPEDRKDPSNSADTSLTARTSVRSRASIGSAGSIFSFGSAGSIASIGSAGSISSIASAGSLASIGSAGSIASVGSVGSIASIGSVASIASRNGFGCVFNVPVADLWLRWLGRRR